MKNIHVLPSSKPSRLHLFNNPVSFKTFERSTQNIYITNNEIIKNGDWYLYQNKIYKLEDERLIAFDSKGIKRFLTDNILGHECKKIILTTDQDLIKDGVQAIDDNFLEWFIKNPSCEEVKVMFVCRGLNGKIPIGEYKIIIPKEETLEELLLEKVESNNTIDLNAYIKGLIDGSKWQQEKMYSEEIINILDNVRYWETCPDDYKVVIESFLEQFKKK